MESFRKLGLKEPLLKAIAALGIKEPTEIQEKTIPLAIAGKDIIGGSATGSGKTLAFGAHLIDNLERNNKIQALIITPTRELAEQIGQALNKFSKFNPIQIAVVYGGMGINPQIRDLEEAEIVVGTPGRILDHLERRTLNLQNIKTLILDEADRMLDMGFIEDVEKIIQSCPKQRQTLLFSATISSDISHLAKKFMREPIEISVDSYVDPSKLHQFFYDVPSNIKFSLLVHLLKQEESKLVMVFCNTRQNTDFVANHLKTQKVEAQAIHGGLSQAKRNKIMEHFHSGHVLVLVCTDVAARGLDIKGVSHVYNYDIPPTSKDYIHRIGRTARAGKEGKAISIVAQRDYENFRSILKNPEISIKQEKTPEVEPIKVNFRARSEGGNFRREFRSNREDRRGGGRSYGRDSRGGYRGNREDSGERRSFERRDRSHGRSDDSGSNRGSRFNSSRRDSRRDNRRSNNYSRRY